MFLTSLSAKNIFRYPELNLKFDNKVYLVLGKINGDFAKSNGAGKSALIDTILYALYEKTLRKGITDITTDHKQNMKMEVEFDNKKIKRSFVDGKRSVSLIVDGEEQIGLKKELQSFISDKIDFDLFRFITIFTPTNNFFSLNDVEKKDLLISLTKNDKIDDIYEMVKEDLDDLKSKNFDILINNYENVLKEKDSIDLEFNKIQKKYEKYNRYEEGLYKYSQFIKVRKQMFEQYFDNKKKFLKLKDDGKKLKKIVADLEEVDLDNSIKVMSEYQEKINSNERTITDLEKKMNMIKEEGKCPVCRQDLKDKEKILQDYQDDISDCKQQIQISKDLLNKEKTEYLIKKKQKEENDKLTMDFNEIKVKFNAAKESHVKNKIAILALYKEYKDCFEYKNTDVTLQDIADAKIKYGQLSEKVKNLEDIEKKYKEIKKEKKNLDEEIVVLEEIKKIFSKDGIKQFIIQKITDFLKDKINEMIVKIFDDMEIDIKLDFTEKRNMMNITISRGTGTEFNIDELSTGERRLVEMVFQLAISDLFEMVSGDTVNLSIFDETFDALDSNNIDKIVNVLKMLEEKNKTTFIISHNSEVKKYFNNIILVEKDNGKSRLIQ